MALPLLIAAAVGVGLGIKVFGKGKSLLDASNLLQYKVKAKNFNVGFTNVKFDVQVDMVNPTNEVITIKDPAFKIMYGSKQMGYSQPNSNTTIVQAMQTTTLTGIRFEIGYLDNINFFSDLGGEIAKSFKPFSLAKAMTAIQNSKTNIFKKLFVRSRITINGIPIDADLPIIDETPAQ